MKTPEEIRRIRGLVIRTEGEDGGEGYLFSLDPKKENRCATVVWSWGGGWDHVSVSWHRRCPTWEEMVHVKNAFFKPDEWAIQYNPPQGENISQVDTCLHLWRPQAEELPRPPYWMVGLRDGQTMSELLEDVRASGADA